MKTKNKYLILLILIGLFIVSCYSTSLKGDFQFDDDLTITENKQIKRLENFLHLNWLDAIFTANRPVTDLSFAINYALQGLDVTGYHVSNIIIHIAVVLLVFVFTRKTLIYSGHKNPQVVALIVAGIFGLHPVQTESVSYISQRAESLASLFYLLSMFFFIHAQEKGFNLKGILIYTTGLFTFIAGLGAKDIVITLPAVYLLYDFYFLGKKSFIKRLIVPMPFIICGLIYFGIRSTSLLESDLAGFSVKETTPFEYLMTQFQVIVTYLRLIVFPINQILDYDYPISRYFFEPRTLASLLFLLIIISLAIVYRKKYRVASFGVIWFFVLIAPTSSFIPIIDVIFEHRIYLGLWGIITAVVILISELCHNTMTIKDSFVSHKVFTTVVISLIVILFMVLGLALYERNKVWQSKLSLWTDVVSKSPNKPRAHNNLGNCFFIQNDYVSAIPHYKKAIELDRKWYESYYNLAVSLEKINEESESVYYYLIFAREAPQTYNNLKTKILKKYNLSR